MEMKEHVNLDIIADDVGRVLGALTAYIIRQKEWRLRCINNL